MQGEYKLALEKIVELAAKSPVVERDEDFNPADWAGGNFDDAYQLGVDDGYADGLWEAARIAAEVLTAMRGVTP